MSSEEIREYFVKCREYDEDNHMNIEEIPSVMREKNTWKVVDSTLTVAEIKELENGLQMEFPKSYKDYLMASAHLFEKLIGKFDNFFFEDDVDIVLKIQPQPYGEELKYVHEMLEENIILVRENYLPLGIFDDNGYLCIDLIMKLYGFLLKIVLVLLSVKSLRKKSYIFFMNLMIL